MNLNAIKKLRDELDKHYYKCNPWCFECCTTVPIMEKELPMMIAELRRQGFEEPPNGKWDEYCEFLTAEGKCSVYAQRPMICRSFSWTKWILQKEGKKVATGHCTYGDWKEKIASPEFIRYWMEINKSGIAIGSREMLREFEKIKEEKSI